jgi:CxxC motif-containing protein
MEQMMIQSMANIQFEALRKMFIEYPIKIGDLLSKNPKEL